MIDTLHRNFTFEELSEIMEHWDMKRSFVPMWVLRRFHDMSCSGKPGYCNHAAWTHFEINGREIIGLKEIRRKK